MELKPAPLPPGWDRRSAVRSGTGTGAGREGGAERAGGAAGDSEDSAAAEGAGRQDSC